MTALFLSSSRLSPNPRRTIAAAPDEDKGLLMKYLLFFSCPDTAIITCLAFDDDTFPYHYRINTPWSLLLVSVNGWFERSEITEISTGHTDLPLVGFQNLDTVVHF